MSNKNIESNLKKLLKGEKACYPEEFLKVPSYNSPTLRTGKGRPISEGQFGKMYRGSINNDGKRYVAYKEIDTSDSINGAFEFEFKVAQKLKEFAVPDVYLFKKCPIQDKTPQKIRKGGKPGSKMGHWLVPGKRKKPKDILYMELLDAQPFNSWWQSNPSLDAIKSVIVQVFDNLYRINQQFPKFRHRDLHGGNVMVSTNALKTQYTWKVDLGRKVIRNDPGGSFRSRIGSPDIKQYKRTNAGVEATIIDFGLSYWNDRMPNPETARGGYEHAGIHATFPGTIRYDTHRFLYIIYAKVRQPQNSKERAIKNFIEELVPNKRYFDFNGPFTSQGFLVNDAWAMQNLPSFKTILSHPFLTGEKSPNRPKTLANALGMIPKAKTPVKAKTPKAKTKTPSPKLSTAERKKKMNNAIKKAAAVLAANKNKAKPAQRRPGAARSNPVPEIKTATPTPKANAPYGEMSPSNIMNLAREIESGRKKAANKLNAKLKEIKATKGKTPTPVRLKQRYTFTDIKGKKREFVRKFAYDRALAKNKAEREKVEAEKEKVKAEKKEYWRSFVDVHGKKQEFESQSAYHRAKQKNLQEYAAKQQEKIKRQMELGRKARLNPQKYSFVDVNGKKREYVRKHAYEKALAKNKDERERRAQPTWSEKARVKRYERGQPFNMKTPQNVRNAIKAGKNIKFVGGRFKTVTPKATWSNANNKRFMELLAREKNAMKKRANKMNESRPLRNGPTNPAVAYAHKTPKAKTSTAEKKIGNYVNGLTKKEHEMLKKKICD